MVTERQLGLLQSRTIATVWDQRACRGSSTLTAFRLGWRRLFASALTLIAAGGCALAWATTANPVPWGLAWVFAGMVLIGTGAALSHPQLSGAVMALAPPEVSGMASALTVVAWQTGFATVVAALGALTPSDLHMAGFA